MKLAKEFIFIPIVLLIFTFLVTDAYGFLYGNIARVIFPTDTSTMQLSKIYFTSVMAFIILEYFIISALPHNYFFSRMLGMLTMMSLFIIIDTFYNVTIFIQLLIIFSGCLISYVTQITHEIRYQSYLGLFILIITLIYIMVITF